MIEPILNFLHNLIDPDWVQSHGGLFLVAFIVFAETGLFVGFFLPGDSLLFVTGMIIAQSAFPFDNHILSLVFWIVIIGSAGIIGNYVGYWFGKKSGNYLYQRKDSFLFKQKHLKQAHAFYEKKGGTAIILARFVPIVRTFAPIVAGIVKMDFKKFTFFNFIGSFAWVISMMVIGFILGENEWVKSNLEKIVIAVILITTLPVLYKMIFGKHTEETTN